MTFTAGTPVIDTMIAFPREGSEQYDFIRRQTKDAASRAMAFPAEHVFTDAPKEPPGDDPIGVTLREMDRHHVEIGLIGVDDEVSRRALAKFPERFAGACAVDPNTGMDGVRKIVRDYEELGIRAVTAFPAGTFPQVPIDDRKMYPIYAKCVELDLPIFVCAGVPGPRLKMDPQRVERIDEVMYDFPELVFVTRHGCRPWVDLAVALMVKWPNLYYSTSAFAPKHYPKAIVDYANTRGADRIIYGGYFPMGLSLERIFAELPGVPFRDHVWPRFLHENARRVLKLDPRRQP
ncbi:amidohydrolase family protein [Actinomadura sp. DC4]|uniref:amidohydrolase family protein n=1 Tax=Actinomadura sp. DC4 TaxID=3055069 RepID=UPI0025B25FDA|nr:amidohydrolase family protein [Actinomadura sp. DC4]MDN3357555.1 amidohydrolase family protein [Actinomadura sp. DC4]